MAFDPKEMTEQQLLNMENDADLGAVDLPRISAQLRYFVAARVGGMSASDAAREAGAHPSTGATWDKLPEVQAHMQHYDREMSEQVMPRVKFGKEDAHQMYINSYHLAGTSAEMTRATDSLVKLHKLLDDPAEDQKQVNTPQQLEGLSTQQLLHLAAMGMDSLQPGEVYDAEDVTDEDTDGEL
ncbi:hypothetical protein [Vreelandella jeotgali]|uniref:hypothetical protein n=1 Tax=Vreelandella jeotgali TaxID=553386 RepID=UPI0003453E9F|nr:hypothetical protein [Halomonas jeotgali]